MDRDLPEGVIDANPPGAWEGVADGESAEQSAQSAGSPELADDPDQRREGHPTDVGIAPDDPVAGEEVRHGADPDLAPDDGEES